MQHQQVMADTWSRHSVILTPTNPPPPSSTLTHRGSTLFNRVLQALRARSTRVNDRTEETSWKVHNVSTQSQQQCCINSSTQSQQQCCINSSTQSQQQCCINSSTQSQQHCYLDSSTQSQQHCYLDSSTQSQQHCYLDSSTQSQQHCYLDSSTQSQQHCYLDSSTQSQQHCYLDSSTQSQQHCYLDSSTQSRQQDSSTHPSLFQPENQFGSWSSGLSYTQSKQTRTTLNLLHQHVLSSQSEKQDDSQELFSHSCQHSFGSGLTLKQAIPAETKHSAFGVRVSTQCHLDQYWNTTNRKKPASMKSTNFSTPCTVSTECHSAPHTFETASPLPESESKGKTLCPSSGSKRSLQQAILSTSDSGKLKKPSHPPRSADKPTNPCREKSSKGCKTSGTDVLHDARCMSAKELKDAEVLFAQAAEVAATLAFSDGSTLLREVQNKKTTFKRPTEVDGVCLALAVHGAQKSLYHIFLPLNPADKGVDGWCRMQFLRLMSRARVICYDGQELVSSLIPHFDLEDGQVFLSWHLLDTRVGAWLLDPDHPPQSFSQLLSRFNMQQLSTSAMERENTRIFVCKDLALLGPLMVRIYQKLQKEELWSLFAELEVKLIPILGAMEVRGVRVNCGKLLHYADLLKDKISKVEARAHQAAGRSFSINSTVQLRQVLFDELHLDEKCSQRLSKTQVQRQKSTSEAVLTQLQDLHPLPALVLEYRQLCKVNATYVTGVLPYISEGILKPCWQHTGTATGRLACYNPNIQAFPKQPINLGVVREQHIVGKTAEEVRIDIREAVESRPGFTFLAADFRSIELRLLAHLSGDPVLINTLNSRQSSDVFILLASEWFTKKPEEVTPSDREKAKRVVYAVVYGVGKEKLAEILKIHPSHAKELTNSFLSKFQGVQAFMHNTVAESRKNGHLSTVCQRKRWFPNTNSANIQLKLHSDRQAVNFPVQGSAADVCKFSMLKVIQMLARESPRTRLLLQIHDELLLEVPDEEMKTIAVKVKALLESASLLPCTLKVSVPCTPSQTLQCKVPLEVNVTAGKTWATLLPVQ